MKKIFCFIAVILVFSLFFTACGNGGTEVSPNYNGPEINTKETAQKLYPLRVNNTDDKDKIKEIIDNLPFAEGLTLSSFDITVKEDGTPEILVKYGISAEKYVLRNGLMIEDPTWRNMALTLALVGDIPSIRFIVYKDGESLGEFYWQRTDAEEYLEVSFDEVVQSEEVFADFIKMLAEWHQ